MRISAILLAPAAALGAAQMQRRASKLRMDGEASCAREAVGVRSEAEPRLRPLRRALTEAALTWGHQTPRNTLGIPPAPTGRGVGVDQRRHGRWQRLSQKAGRKATAWTAVFSRNGRAPACIWGKRISAPCRRGVRRPRARSRRDWRLEAQSRPSRGYVGVSAGDLWRSPARRTAPRPGGRTTVRT